MTTKQLAAIKAARCLLIDIAEVADRDDERFNEGGHGMAVIDDLNEILDAIPTTSGGNEFQVVYAIDVNADSPRAAAERTLDILRSDDPERFPPIFQVTDANGEIFNVELA